MTNYNSNELLARWEKILICLAQRANSVPVSHFALFLGYISLDVTSGFTGHSPELSPAPRQTNAPA